MTTNSLWEQHKLCPETDSTLGFHQATYQLRRPCRTPSSTSSSPLTNKMTTRRSPPFHHWRPYRIHPKVGSHLHVKNDNLADTPIASIPAISQSNLETCRNSCPFWGGSTMQHLCPRRLHRKRFLMYGITAGELCWLLRLCRLCFDEYGIPAEQSYDLPQRPCQL